MVTSEGAVGGQRLLRVRGRRVTFSVVEDSLDEDGVLCESLCHQQDALLNTMTTQQRTTTDTLSTMGRRQTECQHQHRNTTFTTRLNKVTTSLDELKQV